MKQLFFPVLCLLAFAGEAQDFNAGVRIGMAASQVSGDQLTGFNKAGMIVGAFVNREFSESTALQMEIVFIQKGSRKPVTTDANTFYRLRLHYLEVPLLFRYGLAKNLFLQGGPSFGTLFFSQEDNQLGVIEGTPPFNKLEISANAGLAYKLSDRWILDGRYSWSLTPVRDYSGSFNYNYFDRGQYNSVVEVSLGFSF